MPQVFSAKERAELKTRMLSVGFELLKEYGMTHTSVEKVTKAVGLGRSTFYNFFGTKEEFIYEIINFQMKKGIDKFHQILNGREKMTVSEAKEYLKYLYSGEDTIYPYLTTEDESKLQKALPDDFKIDVDIEIKTIDSFLVHMENVKENLDYKVIANLMKTLALIQEANDMLHQDAIPRTLDAMFELLFSLIFNNDD
ncbi:UNVERIFIED_CONTAM: TetR/AcrR family transcriptional regulator [Clostridioides difficile]|uniref:TetR/AcrR family transcriptional regulator n=1 Tax=Clostridioides difficile TaxID=1496 RepID=UPI00038CAC6E|nr:TetR/AcrR family transcriptional regulator [Clostridioides difficile]EQE85555.1 bacterial regulatory s, tetR family protein [Clostridioides difficile CD69]HBF7937263.1 TetR/AcrR family transcriptional regulator [Clostridioides difficile]HBG6490588.1 TetR/AcrR family transcriptional regulator [Clostridioides difficile]HBY2627430.1 TetR/AcrR family transcriptional regulator [Clostridioides difficile]HBY3616230.1 TetR/AcrR family transcriptional regulator [Clostridioides difficile]